jgi:hypothetical protein
MSTITANVTCPMRVSSRHLATMIVGKTMPEALASVFAYGYRRGFDAGRLEALTARTAALGDDNRAVRAEADQAIRRAGQLRARAREIRGEA